MFDTLRYCIQHRLRGHLGLKFQLRPKFINVPRCSKTNILMNLSGSIRFILISKMTREAMVENKLNQTTQDMASYFEIHVEDQWKDSCLPFHQDHRDVSIKEPGDGFVEALPWESLVNLGQIFCPKKTGKNYLADMPGNVASTSKW